MNKQIAAKWQQFLVWRQKKRQTKIDRGKSYGFDWPRMKTVSVPTGRHHITSVIVRSYWIRAWFSPVHKHVTIGPFMTTWSPDWRKPRLELKLPWEDGTVWVFYTPLTYTTYRPRWAQEAHEIWYKAGRPPQDSRVVA